MNKLKKILTLLILLTVCWQVSAQNYKLEKDVKTAAQVTANMGLSGVTESIIRDTLILSRKRNDSIATMATAITALKILYHNARRNVSGWGNESAVYKRILQKANSINSKLGPAISVCTKNPLKAAGNMETITRLYGNAVSLVKQFCSIVANGRVVNPFTGKTTFKYTKCPKCGGAIDIIETGNPRKPYVYACKNKTCGWDTGSEPDSHDDGSNGDGYNFLSSRDRYMMANSILVQLNSIDWDLTVIIYTAQRNSNNKWTNIIKNVDWHTYSTLVNTKYIANDIINRWNSLGH